MNQPSSTTTNQPPHVLPHVALQSQNQEIDTFINRRSISTRPALRNITKPRLYTNNIPATVTTQHKASNYHSITRPA